jgi:hypothetical protein
MVADQGQYFALILFMCELIAARQAGDEASRRRMISI